MNISVLNDSEVKRLCALVPGKDYREYFKKNPEHFAQIKSGYRPNGISDAEAVNLAVTYIDMPFINDFINKIANKWLAEIRLCLDAQKETSDQDEALAQTLVDSYFADDVDLYFKLTEFVVKDEIIDSVSKRISEIRQSRQISKNETKDENSVSMELTVKTYEQQIAQLTKECVRLESELEESRLEIDDLNKQLAKTEFEVNHFREMQKYDDADMLSHIGDSEYDHISVCEVLEPDYLDQQYILRLFDVNSDGTLTAFYPNPDEPLLFSNRNRLFYKDGPSEVGRIGVWEWSAGPRNSDPSKDYILSAYNANISAVEVFTFSDCSSLEDVISKLKDGISAEVNTERVIFAFRFGAASYKGVLCTKKQLKISSAETRLDDEVISLPVYKFSGSNVLRAPNDRLYYCSIDLGIPSDVIHVKNQLDIVKDIISSRCSWNAFKQIGKSRSEWKIARDFLGQVDTKSIVDEIAKACNCSSVEANELYEEFLGRVDVYIDGKSLDDQLILAVIAKNDDLLVRCKSLLTEEWRQENIEAIEAQNRERESKASELAALRKEEDFYSHELSTIKTEIAKQKKMSEEVKQAVEKTINEAQNNAAEFIAKMAFVSPKSHFLGSDEKVDRNDVFYTPAIPLDCDDYDENSDWNNVVDTVSFELIEAGVIDKYARPLAAYLHAAKVNHISLLIAGPNAAEIVDAYSIGFSGYKAGTIDCDKCSGVKRIEKIREIDEQIVKIINPFSSNGIQNLEYIANEGNFNSFAVHPYSEDLQLEPRSVFSYFIPLYTDLLVNKRPGRNHIAGKLSSNYSEFVNTAPTRNCKTLGIIKMSPLANANISRLISDMKTILEDDNDDYSLLFSILPYSHATGQISTIIGILDGENRNRIDLSEELKTQINSWYGVSNG